MPTLLRGVRGATRLSEDSREALLVATGELLLLMVRENDIKPEDVASAWFTTTPDLVAEYPALAARKLGWKDVPLLCAHEMNVPHGLAQCVRILLHWNTAVAQADIRHVYIRGAEVLRPDNLDLYDVPEVAEVPFDLD